MVAPLLAHSADEGHMFSCQASHLVTILRDPLFFHFFKKI